MSVTINPSAQSITNHNVLIGGANNLVTNIVPGVAGTVLTSNGVSSNCSFQAQGSGTGTFVLLETQTVGAPVASLDFVTGISGTYANYALTMNNVRNATNTALLCLRTSSDGGATYNTTGYTGRQINVQNDFSGSIHDQSFTNKFVFTDPLGSGQPGVSGNCFLYGLTSGSTTSLSGQFSFINSSIQACIGIVAGGYSTNLNVDALRLFFSSGNISAGTVSLYGIVE